MGRTVKDIVNEIKDDHKTLRALLKEGVQKNATLDEKKEIFDELAIVVTAHIKSEEAAAYAPTCRIEETKKEAFVGFEEHELIELLIEELNSETTNMDKWEAKFTVVCELLEYHIEEEEGDYLPLIEEVCSSNERKLMGEEYRETFQRLERAQRQISHPFSNEEQLRNH